MTQKLYRPHFKFTAFLAITTALAGITANASNWSSDQASNYGSYDNPAYNESQSLPQLSPDQVAGDIEARFDPLTGRTEYFAPDFDPFENSGDMAGSASLRSASTGISKDGENVSGGAYLDVSVLYTAGSRDPYDAKGYEHAVYLSGQPVDIMSYDVQTLDCTSDVTKVTYDDSYYRGSHYGYVGGLYRLFPRYRGHRNYSSRLDRIRYGSWRGLSDSYYGHHGYDHRRCDHSRGLHGNHRDGRRGDRDRRHADNDRHDDHNAHNQGRNRDELRDRIDRRDDVQDRDWRQRVPSGVAISTRNLVNPNQLGDRRIPTQTVNTQRRPVKEIHSSPRLQPVKPPSTAPRLTNVTPRLSNATPRLQSRPVIRPDRPGERSSVRSSERRLSISPAQEVITRSRAPEVRRNVSPPKARSQPTPSRTVSRPSNSPKARSESRSNSNSSRSSRSTRSRAVDKTFSSRNKTSKRPFRYYPASYGQTTTYVDTRCVKEERLSLHIPAERLEAARFDGLSLILLDHSGQDVPIYIPPNYIEGFRRANPYLRQNTYFAPTQPYGTYPGQGG